MASDDLPQELKEAEEDILRALDESRAKLIETAQTLDRAPPEYLSKLDKDDDELEADQAERREITKRLMSFPPSFREFLDAVRAEGDQSSKLLLEIQFLTSDKASNNAADFKPHRDEIIDGVWKIVAGDGTVLLEQSEFTSSKPLKQPIPVSMARGAKLMLKADAFDLVGYKDVTAMHDAKFFDPSQPIPPIPLEPETDQEIHDKTYVMELYLVRNSASSAKQTGAQEPTAQELGKQEGALESRLDAAGEKQSLAWMPLKSDYIALSSLLSQVNKFKDTHQNVWTPDDEEDRITLELWTKACAGAQDSPEAKKQLFERTNGDGRNALRAAYTLVHKLELEAPAKAAGKPVGAP